MCIRDRRTPTSSFDPAAGKDIYEPEKIVAQRNAKGITQWQVKWVGFEAKHNTWEPLGSLLGGKIKKEPEKEQSGPLDELEQYLADTDVPDFDDDVLKWWHARELKWPRLAKMVEQYFATPASSAGVERVFSAAGKMHTDLKKSAKDTTLEHSLFAAFNTD